MQVEEGSPAMEELETGESLVSVNGIPVRGQEEAEQLIDSAFSTLTLILTRYVLH